MAKGENSLDIGGCDGCSKILPALDGVLEMNRIGAKEEQYDRIVILVDRDEIETEARYIDTLKEICSQRGVVTEQEPVNDQWIRCKCMNGQNREIEFQILLLILPFEETGAMETFLLKGKAKDFKGCRMGEIQLYSDEPPKVGGALKYSVCKHRYLN